MESSQVGKCAKKHLRQGRIGFAEAAKPKIGLQLACEAAKRRLSKSNVKWPKEKPLNRRSNGSKQYPAVDYSARRGVLSSSK